MVGAPPVVMLMMAIGPLLDDLEKGGERFGTLIRSTVFRVSGMQVDDCSTGLGSADRSLSNFLGL